MGLIRKLRPHRSRLKLGTLRTVRKPRRFFHIHVDPAESRVGAGSGIRLMVPAQGRGTWRRSKSGRRGWQGSSLLGTPFSTGSWVRLRCVLTIMVAKSAYWDGLPVILALASASGPGHAVGAVDLLGDERHASRSFISNG